jgi:hypothetical protein
VVDLIEGNSYSEIQLNGPLQALIPLPCGHAFTAETMDGLFELSRGYTQRVVPATAVPTAVAAAAVSTAVAAARPAAVEGASSSSGGFSGSRSGSSSNISSSVGTTAVPAVVWTGLKQLEGQWSLKRCPSCKSPVHGVFRYSRVQRKAELEALEQKFQLYCQKTERELRQATLAATEGADVVVPSLQHYIQLVDYVKRASPTRRLFEACQHTQQRQQQQLRSSSEVPLPPAAPLLDALLALGLFCVESTAAAGSSVKRTGELCLRDAIKLADDTQSLRSAGRARLLLARLLLSSASSTRRLSVAPAGASRSAVRALLDWILQHTAAPVVELQRDAEQLLRVLEDTLTTAQLAAIMREVERFEGGYPLGWNGQGHWFTCPNGHIYYIGECGGAMQQSSCPECGAVVGGIDHRLAAGNARFDLAAVASID